MQQAEDYHDAVVFARSLPGIDKSRVAIWGIGHSAGASMIAAGDDPFVKAVVLVMPFTSGAYDAANYPPGVMERVWVEREARLLGKREGETYVPVWDNSKESVLQDRGQTLLHGEVAYTVGK
jgi:dipeptidyl aminopeptidase/acylaminoacyl peptidase